MACRARPLARAGRAACRLALVTAASAAGLLTPQASTAGDRGPVKSLLEMREHNVVVQKFDLSCGAAVLATVLNFQHGDSVTERQVAEGLIRRKEYIENPELVRYRQGFSLLDMKRYVDSRGYVGVGYGRLQVKDLVRLAPIIIATSPLGYSHFVVFQGLDGSRVLLADPAFGNMTMSLEKFERIWIDFPNLGRVGFIVTRDGKPVPPNLLAPDAGTAVAPENRLVRQAFPF